jgi:integrase
MTSTKDKPSIKAKKQGGESRSPVLGLIKQINIHLKRDFRTKTRIGLDRNSVYIQYNDGLKQRKISPPSVSLSNAGIYRARDLAIQIDNALRTGLYSDSWVKSAIYGVKPEKPKEITLGQVKTDLKRLWLEDRANDSKSDRQKNATFHVYQLVFNNAVKIAKLKDSELVNEVSVNRLLSSYEHNHSRLKLITVTKLIIKLFKLGLNVDFDIRRPKAAKKRDIKMDDKIAETFESLSEISQASKRQINASIYYQWVYGILATYGLRPHEIQAIDWEKSFKPETDNWLFIREEITEGTKTGSREIAPLLPEWVELFDLRNKPENPSKAESFKQLTALIDSWFKSKGIGKPYDLRHAYGIRSKRFLSVIDAAYCMGHSVEVHTRIYHSHENLESKLFSVREGLRQRGY